MLVHISNNFLGSTVHSDLVKALEGKDVGPQFVYCPLQRKFKGNSAIEPVENVVVAAPRIFNQLLRYFPLVKVFWSYFNFFLSIRKNGVKPGFIVAHNLWSDGMVAWLYSKFSGTPFVVAVRNTDLNHFIPKLPHYRWIIKRIVKDAENVIFINRAYACRLRKNFPLIYNKINRESIIYNGIDDEWFGLAKHQGKNKRENQVCYLGGFVKNKNLKNSVLAIQLLRGEGADIKYVAIGGSEKQFLSATELEEIPRWVKVVERVADKEVIAQYLSDSRVFLMPSFKETFGLVYIEALSQGCCIVHSQGEGIDGVFNEPFIRSVNPASVSDIADKVRELINNYPTGVPVEDVNYLIGSFSWDEISARYLDIISRRCGNSIAEG